MSMGIDCAIEALERARMTESRAAYERRLAEIGAEEEKRERLRGLMDDCPACDSDDVDEIDSADLDRWIASHAALHAPRHEAIGTLATRARTGDPVALAAVRDLLTIPDLPAEERAALIAAQEGVE